MTANGTHILKTDKATIRFGGLVAVNELTMEVKQGDTVLFAKYSGTEFHLDDEELLVLNERDVLAIVENGK